MPLAELYNSLALIEEFMAQESIIQYGHRVVTDDWPLVFPLMMATGHAKYKYAVTSPFPAEAFAQTSLETNGEDAEFEKPLRTRGPDAIVQGEYMAVFLREADLGRLRYGLVTRDAQGQLQVCDPADVGDVAARLAWSRGIGGLPRWTDENTNTKEELKYSNIALLDAGAVEKMFAAANELASRKDKITRQLQAKR
ncbi:hypothetical protein E0Z10_g1179 [Xylaria hypoxylon]|uniref:Uncharacterized protein n=1 Tax=Xylaria hypoxylon TaxID=37992 RepID=A0A4Z0Z773_9PEZI|nr:hypothetical protein E0Z10_g1179 [Xylaria hypoxylon]